MSEGWASLAYPPSQEDVEAGRFNGKPNPAQLAYLALTTFVQIFIAGFGSGKTTTGAVKALIHMVTCPGSRGAAVGPTYRHTRNQYRAMMALLERIKLQHGVDLVRKAKVSQAESVIELTNGSTVEFFSAAGKAGLYGWDGTWVWLDELEWFDSPETYYSDVQTRVRQVSDPGIADIHYRTIYITSTAQYSVGILQDKLEEAQAQAEKAKADLTYQPTVGAVVCPSTVAVGHGLTRERIETWASEMEPGAFLRGVMCLLKPPPEVVYADYVGERHLVDWDYVPGLPSYYMLDWGIRPHWIFGQMSPSHNALILIDEWGLDDSSTREFVKSMVGHAKAHGLADPKTGTPLRKEFAVFGDPTPDTNYGRKGLRADSQAYLQEDGRRVLREYGWPFVSPADPRRRAKWLQIQLIRSLLRPGSKQPPRILISRKLAGKRDQVTRHSHTRRGIYHALTEGVRFPRDKRTDLIREGAPIKDGVFEHAYDALCFGVVMIFNQEFDRLCSLDHGRLSGAGAW